MEKEYFLPRALLDDEEFGIDIHTASSIGLDEEVDSILNVDSDDLNEKNKGGWTPLMYACSLEHVKTVSVLLERGANVLTKNMNGQSALLIATRSGNAGIVSMLLQVGADKDDVDNGGRTAIAHAALLRQRSVLQVLAEKGAKVDAEDVLGRTPLMLAAQDGHELMVRDLLRMGANVNARSSTGETALSLAIQMGHSKVADVLETYLENTNGLVELLHELRLSKYLPLFQRQGIDLQVFWMLDDEDLKDIGIHILGPRKALLAAIEEHNVLPVADYRTANILLLSENRRLRAANKELQAKADRCKLAEHELNEGVQSLKAFSKAIKRTVTDSLLMQEKLRLSLIGLKRMMANPRGPSPFPLFSQAEKWLDEITRLSHVSLIQNTFKE